MREDVKRDEKFPNDETTGEDDAMLDILMLQTALLMRIYDALMENLSAVNSGKAKDLWALHESGGHKNPPTMVPVFEVRNED